MEKLSDILSGAMYNYQMLEMALRAYIKGAIQITKRKLNDLIPHNVYPQDIETLPLGNLLSKFKIYSDDKDLIKMIDECRLDRNEIAHLEFVKISRIHFAVQEVKDIKTAELRQYKDRAEKCYMQVFKRIVELNDKYYSTLTPKELESEKPLLEIYEFPRIKRR